MAKINKVFLGILNSSYYLCVMEYLVNDIKYNFSYKGLKEDYHRLIAMSDKEFLENLPTALHFACFCSYVKELGLEATLGEEGIIHNLIHLIHIPNEPLVDLRQIRKSFKELLLLA